MCLLAKPEILSDSIRVTMAFAIPCRAAPLYTIQSLLWLCISQLVLSLQTWQRSQEPGIYVIIQQRIASSSGFLRLTLPGRTGLTAHRKVVCPIPQAGMDMARLECVKWKKKTITENSRAATAPINMAVLCLTTYISGERCASHALLGQNSSWLPHLSSPAHKI